ncbi:histone-like nucleoid-structuring protein Lsr2 [Streptomyces sp. NPDC006333]|uniref:Lsr2 family DNA-binding protein n=1 Tax=Streptomyces sp. NPDC006333 TaxID=3156753 RepID=UPI0033AF1FA2
MSEEKAILVATSSVVGEYDGQPLYIHKGVTTVRDGHPLLNTFGALFEPLKPMFEVDGEPDTGSEQEPAVPPVSDAPAAPAPAADPAPKDVRAWAAEHGIEVSPKGKIPDAVVEQYQAAHTEA